MANLTRAVTTTRPEHAAVANDGGMLHSVRLYPLFRTLLLGTLASNTAFWMYQVAVGWLALEMTDSPFFVGLAGFASGIPVLLFSLPAGVAIDRFDKRTVLAVAQAGIMIVAGLISLLVATDLITRWSLLLLVFAYGTIMSFIFPTRTAMVPSLVERDDLANAVALNAATQNATRVVGPSLAGVLIAVTGVWETFAIAALLQVFALTSTSKLPSNVPTRSSHESMGWRSLTVGLRIVFGHPVLSALIVIALAPTVLVMPYINLMPVFARDELDLGSSGLGFLLASVGVGTVVGALSVAQSPRIRGSPSVMVGSAIGFTIMVLLFSVTSFVPLAIVLLFAAGWMSAVFLAVNQTTLQLTVADDVRGRVLSIYLMTWGMLPLGQLAVGALASQIGPPLAMASFCVLALGCIGAIAWHYPSLRGAPSGA
ncbi:MAG TPA: MFS transporter [Thermomicrobiales bacterium]|nr:MFS transporter [Thermomicrobiales bacterium]